MSIAINLLPDVRLARLRAQHIRHVVTGISVAIWIVAGIVVGALFLGIGTQKLVLNNVNHQIATDTNEIESTPNLNQALTTQQILQNLPSLYNGRVYYSKLMPLITSVLPSKVTISSVATDSTGAISMSGQAPSAYVLDQLYESLKASGKGTPQGANFSGVSINSESRDASGAVPFSITATLSSQAVRQGVTNG